MHIIQVQADDTHFIEQAARLLTDLFPQTQEWETHEGAVEEVNGILEEGQIFAMVEDEQLLGWIGTLRAYNDNTWELHPLAVRSDQQGRGIGRALVLKLEEIAHEAGVWTIMLGTDDEKFQTTLSQVDDLYNDLAGHIARMANLDENNPHPFSFYQKMGYQVVGIIPDANGPGKPDIFMAKRIRRA